MYMQSVYLCEMGLCVELEMLAFLLLLTPLISGGLLMPKCKLVDELNLIVPQDVVDRENLVAELTCRAEIAAQFKTSHKNQVSSKEFFKVRKSRAALQTTNSPITRKPGAKSETIPHRDSSTNPPPKSNINLPPKKNINTWLDPFSNPPPKSNNNPPPKNFNTWLDSSTYPLPKLSNNPPPKNTINTRLDSSTNPPPKTNTNLPPKNTFNPHMDSASNPPPISFDSKPLFKTKQSRNLVLKPLNNPQDPQEKLLPMQGASSPYPPNFNSTYMSPRKRRGLNGLLTLYGMFQLADRLACTSSAKIPSFNLCNMPCNKLTDDDITDDINCVLTILKTGSDRKTKPEIQNEANRLIRNLSRMLKNTCPDMNAAKYLAECQNP